MQRDSLLPVLRIFSIAASIFLLAGASFGTAGAAFTPKQLEAFSTRVGKTYWTKAIDNRSPVFLSRPAPGAPSFPAPANESFVIMELVAQNTSTPYYKVKFASDKEGYITPQGFHEELNLTIFSVEPDADQKRKEAQAAEQEKQRKAWIASQAWSDAVKEAALNRRAVPGMTTKEVLMVVGEPIRVVKGKNARLNLPEERWMYADGSELLFQNTLLVRITRKDSKSAETTSGAPK
jgi:hypothetical protein